MDDFGGVARRSIRGDDRGPPPTATATVMNLSWIPMLLMMMMTLMNGLR